MAFVLTPRFAPAYQASECHPFGLYAPTSQSSYRHCPIRRAPHQTRPSNFASFFSQLDNLVQEIDRESQRHAQIEAQREAQRVAEVEAQREAYRAHVEAQRAAYRQRQAQIEAHIAAEREAHRQRLLRERALRTQFAVTQNEQGWQVDAQVPGFEQGNINIEVTDESTLTITGNTEWGTGAQTEAASKKEAPLAADQPALSPTSEEITKQTIEEKIEVSNLESAAEVTTEDITTDSTRPVTPDSDTSSQRSFQATVEDDFEDLGPEASTLFPTPSAPSQSKGKGRAVEPAEHHEVIEDPETSIPETEGTHQTQPENPDLQQRPVAEERPQRSFERTFQFPGRIDASNVRASMKEGVLSITVPRAQMQQVRRIAIL